MVYFKILKITHKIKKNKIKIKKQVTTSTSSTNYGQLQEIFSNNLFLHKQKNLSLSYFLSLFLSIKNLNFT